MGVPFGRITIVVAFAGMLAACSTGRSDSTTFAYAKRACEPDVIQNQFMVRFHDGRRVVVHAKGEDDFIEHYLEPNHQRILYAEPDYRVSVRGDFISRRRRVTEADNWGVRRIDAPALWLNGWRGENVGVATIDTGLDTSHPQLADQQFENPGEVGTDGAGHDRAHNEIDDDGNGMIDDAWGWDFTTSKPLTTDNAYHGTHVAGIIAARHRDVASAPGDHVEGIAPEAKILPLAFLDRNGSGDISAGVSAIDYAANRGVKVINASWGGPDCSVSLREAIASLDSRGVLFVNAAGNESLDVDLYPAYPAALNLASQLTVGAVGELDYVSDFSNFGLRTVHLFAPGSNIVSTLPGGGMGVLSGTSMAAPFVSGAAALLFSAVPTATGAQVRRVLIESALRRDEYSNASRGRLSLSQAVWQLKNLQQN